MKSFFLNHDLNYMKKAIPYLLLLVLFVLALFVKQCRARERLQGYGKSEANNSTETSGNKINNLEIFRDPEASYFFTKHARCRMACRRITQKEVKEIVLKAEVNYNKSDLNDPKGPTYALEGYTTKDRQHLRIIVAPKQRHLSIVTVIDLDKDWECPSCE
jgi:hypothetical protein